MNYYLLEHPIIFVKCRDKTLSDLFLINCVFLSNAPSVRVFDMIHNLDISMVLITLGLLVSAAEIAEFIA